MVSIPSIIADIYGDEAELKGNEYKIRCPDPAHDDTNPSCHLNATSGAWHCKSCNAKGSFATFLRYKLGISQVEAIKMSASAKGDLIQRDEKQKKKQGERLSSKQLPKNFVAKYEYKDSQGACYAVVYRKTNIKALPYTHVGDNQWVNEAPERRLPYRTESLRGHHLLVVEGEKCADAAHNLVGDALDVVTWMGGTNAAHLTDWTALHGLTVYLWPDNDKPGYKVMEFLQEKLHKQDCTCFMLKVPEGYQEKWDVADAIIEWGDRAKEKFAKFMLENRVKYEPNPFADPAQAPATDDYDHDLEAEFANQDDTGTQLSKTSNGLRQALTLLRFNYRYNTRSQQFEVRRTDQDGKLYKAWYKKINYAPGWIPVDDHIRATLIDLIERHFKMPNGKPLDLTNKFDALFLAATVDRQVDDFEDWLNELPPWDGEPRIDMVAIDILGAFSTAEADEADRLLLHMSKSLFLAPIQRTKQPGCTIDEVPVLIGPGEIGKTKFYSYVFPEECPHWYAGPIDFSKDARKELIEMTNGPVVVEIGEMRLSALSESQVARMKDYVTRGNDRVRLAYGRRAANIPRRFSLIATANKKSTGTFYYDVDGHRRFLVVDVVGCSRGPKAAIDYLKSNRLQLWAEALHRYKEGERANIPLDLRFWQKEMAEQHVEIDEAYDGKIAELERRIRMGTVIDYSDKAGMSTFDIGKAMEFNVEDPVKFNRAEQRRLSTALNRRKWRYRQKRIGEERFYRWYAPEFLLKIEQDDG